jgi:hypothetical protein
LTLPVTADRIDTLAVGSRDEGKPTVRAGSIALQADGTPLVVYGEIRPGAGDTFLSWPDGNGWQRMGLQQAMPEAQQNWKVFPPAVAARTESGNFVIVATTIDAGAKGKLHWGASGCEVVRFEVPNPRSPKGIRSRLLSEVNPNMPHWLPNMEHDVGQNRVPAAPGIMYLAGTAGDKNTEIHANDVYWCR